MKDGEPRLPFVKSPRGRMPEDPSRKPPSPECRKRGDRKHRLVDEMRYRRQQAG